MLTKQKVLIHNRQYNLQQFLFLLPHNFYYFVCVCVVLIVLSLFQAAYIQKRESKWWLERSSVRKNSILRIVQMYKCTHIAHLKLQMRDERNNNQLQQNHHFKVLVMCLFFKFCCCCCFKHIFSFISFLIHIPLCLVFYYRYIDSQNKINMRIILLFDNRQIIERGCQVMTCEFLLWCFDQKRLFSSDVVNNNYQ